MSSRAPGGGRSRCNRCSAAIVWFRDDEGRKVPIDASTVRDDQDITLDPERHTNHHEKCPRRAGKVAAGQGGLDL